MGMNNIQINFMESAQIDKSHYLVRSTVEYNNGIYNPRSGRKIMK